MIIQGSAFDIPLANESVQLIVTSPPYFNLRKYKGNNKKSFGQEKSISIYIQHSVEVLRECRRVLKKEGVVFWNIGDSYSGSGKGGGGNSKQTLSKGTTKREDIPPKNLCLIPERIAIAAQDDGWIVRDIIIWHKPNCVPESVKDRCTRSYEVILMLTKSRKYYFNILKEPSICFQKGSLGGCKPAKKNGKMKNWLEPVKKPNGKYGKLKLLPPIGNTKHQKLGKNNLIGNQIQLKETRNKRNVWSIPTKPHKEAHIAMFPEELPRLCILAGSKEGDLVLDCFAGSGTTEIVAKQLGRKCISLEISKDYVKLAKARGTEVKGEASRPSFKEKVDD